MNKPKDIFQQNRAPNPRQLRVGEEIRHALAQIFMRGESNMPDLDGASITVSEVRISPDLKNATAYVMPLGGHDKERLLEALMRGAPELRHLVTKRINLRFSPKIFFKLDESFEEAGKINALLNRPEVSRDLKKNESDS